MSCLPLTNKHQQAAAPLPVFVFSNAAATTSNHLRQRPQRWQSVHRGGPSTRPPFRIHHCLLSFLSACLLTLSSALHYRYISPFARLALAVLVLAYERRLQLAHQTSPPHWGFSRLPTLTRYQLFLESHRSSFWPPHITISDNNISPRLNPCTGRDNGRERPLCR